MKKIIQTVTATMQRITDHHVRMRRRTVRRRIWRSRVFMTVLILALLTACGGKAEPDENSGLYEAVSAKAFGLEMAIEELYEGGMSIELKDGGKAVFTLEGKDYKMKWSHDGSDFQAKGGGAELSGTVEDGVLLLTDVMDSGVDIRLECRSLMRKSSKNDRDSGKDEEEKQKTEKTEDDRRRG